MHRQTVNLVLTRAVLDDILDVMAGTLPAAAIFTGCKVKLFTGATAPSLDSVVADFTETTAVGYVAATIAAWSGPANAVNGKRGWLASPIFVFGDNRPDGVNLAGYYLTNAAGTTLLAAERFTQEVQVVDPGDDLVLDLMLLLPETLFAV